MKITVHILRNRNSTVTSHNFDIIKKAAELSDFQIFDFSDLKKAMKYGNRKDIYVVSDFMEVILLSFCGRKNILYWVQGIIPEESFMRRKNVVYMFLLSFFEKMALNKALMCLFVSKSMESHFISKYDLMLKFKPYIFPCFNTDINESAFSIRSKYDNNHFVYAGGLAIWQCFDETLKVYKYFEELQKPNTKLIVLTKDIKTAEAKIIKEGIKNYYIDYVSKNELVTLLGNAKFGFVLRDNNIVNQVSTPTKISTYLSCGVIPIYGSSILSFAEVAKKMNYAISWNGSPANYKIVESIMSQKIDSVDVLKEYKAIFDNQFSTTNHVNQLRTLLSSIINQN